MCNIGLYEVFKIFYKKQGTSFLLCVGEGGGTLENKIKRNNYKSCLERKEPNWNYVRNNLKST